VNDLSTARGVVELLLLLLGGGAGVWKIIDLFRAQIDSANKRHETEKSTLLDLAKKGSGIDAMAIINDLEMRASQLQKEITDLKVQIASIQFEKRSAEKERDEWRARALSAEAKLKEHGIV
jgi:TolA-binding protein